MVSPVARGIVGDRDTRRGGGVACGEMQSKVGNTTQRERSLLLPWGHDGERIRSAMRHTWAATTCRTCWGLQHRAPRIAGYDPQIYIWPVPTSSNRLGNHGPHIEYGPTTPT
jgi:hypothetical protein